MNITPPQSITKHTNQQQCDGNRAAPEHKAKISRAENSQYTRITTKMWLIVLKYLPLLFVGRQCIPAPWLLLLVMWFKAPSEIWVLYLSRSYMSHRVVPSCFFSLCFEISNVSIKNVLSAWILEYGRDS